MQGLSLYGHQPVKDNSVNLIYSIFTTKKKNLAKLRKRTINYILGKKNYCSGKGLEGNIRTIRASPPNNNQQK